ncbi:hypothetical protein Tco_1530317 [Tanacetum coccineum]
MFKDNEFDVLDDAMENVEGGSTAEQITTAGDTLNTASINVSTTGPSNGSAAGPSTSKGKMVEPEPTPKNPKKAQIQMDEEPAQSDDSGKKDDSSSKQAESSKKRPRAEHDEESVKKHKLQDDAEKEELRACLADGSSKNYKIFSEMLDDFDRQDVMDLHRLVKERYDTISPEGYDLLLWGDLKTLFEPFHVLLMDNGIAIHIMIEKKYPLTQEMLSRMLNRRLEVDHESEMAFELSDLQDHNLRSRRVFGYILLVIKMLIMKKLDD